MDIDFAQIRNNILKPQNPTKHVRAVMFFIGGLAVLPLLLCNRDPLARKKGQGDTPIDAKATGPELASLKALKEQLQREETRLVLLAKRKADQERIDSMKTLVGQDSPSHAAPSPYQAPAATGEAESNEMKAERKLRERRAPIVVISARRPHEDVPNKEDAVLKEAAEPRPKTPHRDGETLPRSKAQARSEVLREGTIIDAVLMNALNGEFTGPAECLVSSSVYSENRQVLLIPAGSIFLGTANRVGDLDQQRLTLTFHRINFPNGSSLEIEHAVGLNQLGEAGVRDQVNRHWGQVAVSAAIHAVINGFGARTVIYNSPSSSRALESVGQSRPTLTIRSGVVVKVALTHDLSLPPYTNSTGEKQ